MTTPPNTAIERILSQGPKEITNTNVTIVDPRDRSPQTNAQINARLLGALIVALGGSFHNEAQENFTLYEEGIQLIGIGLGDKGKINSDAMAQLLAKEIPAMIPSLTVTIDYEERAALENGIETLDRRSGRNRPIEQLTQALPVKIEGADIASPEFTAKLMAALGQAMGVHKSGQVR